MLISPNLSSSLFTNTKSRKRGKGRFRSSELSSRNKVADDTELCSQALTEPVGFCIRGRYGGIDAAVRGARSLPRHTN